MRCSNLRLSASLLPLCRELAKGRGKSGDQLRLIEHSRGCTIVGGLDKVVVGEVTEGSRRQNLVVC